MAYDKGEIAKYKGMSLNDITFNNDEQASECSSDCESEVEHGDSKNTTSAKIIGGGDEPTASCSRHKKKMHNQDGSLALRKAKTVKHGSEVPASEFHGSDSEIEQGTSKNTTSAKIIGGSDEPTASCSRHKKKMHNQDGSLALRKAKTVKHGSEVPASEFHSSDSEIEQGNSKNTTSAKIIGGSDEPTASCSRHKKKMHNQDGSLASRKAKTVKHGSEVPASEFHGSDSEIEQGNSKNTTSAKIIGGSDEPTASCSRHKKNKTSSENLRRIKPPPSIHLLNLKRSRSDATVSETSDTNDNEWQMDGT